MSKETDYLEEERVKIWAKILDLEADIKKKTSDYEKEAKQASKKCSEFKNKCQTSLTEAQGTAKLIKDSQVQLRVEEIVGFHKRLSSRKTELETKIGELETLFSNHAVYAEKVSSLETLAESADESSTKIEATLTQLSSRKKAIDQSYFEIFGQTITNAETGEKTEVIGRKQELDDAYEKLKSDLDGFYKTKSGEFEETLKDWKSSYTAAHNEIQSLLPNALTAGLSAAYHDKKINETNENIELKKAFGKWIYILMGISLIPFFISAYLMIYEGMPLTDALLQVTNLVITIIMLYIPALWIAYSTSKKINLSKRLIEEYTHKEVVTKTFEGLSKQIASIKDQKVSAELKNRLLSNILEISIENPGKLISDYNTSDHPILERLNWISRSNKKPNKNTENSKPAEKETPS